MTEQRNSPTTFSYHPASYITDYSGGFEAIHALYDDSERRRRLGAVADLLGVLEIVSLSKFNERMILEQAMVGTQMNLQDDGMEAYIAQATSPAGPGGLVQWFDRQRRISDRIPVAQLERSKGLAVSLGVEVQAGIWPVENAGNGSTAHLMATLKDQLGEQADFDIVAPDESKDGSTDCSIRRLVTATGVDMKFARLECSRPVADIVCREADPLHIAMKLTALLVIDSMPHDWQSAYRDWPKVEGGKAIGAYGVQLAQAIGSLFEEATVTRDSQDTGFYPESSSHMVRAPYKKQVTA